MPKLNQIAVRAKLQSLAPPATTALAAATPPAESNPVIVYLAALPSPRSKTTMAMCLDNLVDVMMPTDDHAARKAGRVELSFPYKNRAEGIDDQVQVKVYAETLGFAWWRLRYEHTAALRASLIGKYSVAGAKLRLSALSKLMKHCWRLGLLSAEDRDRATDWEPIAGGDDGANVVKGRRVTADERRELFRVAMKQPAAEKRARDTALLSVAFGLGLRRAELVALNMVDYVPNHDAEEEAGLLQVRFGKGGKSRSLYVVGNVKLNLDEYLAVRGSDPGALFLPCDRGGHLVHNNRRRAGRELRPRLTPANIWALLDDLQTQIGTSEADKFGPHDMRRDFVSNLLDDGADVTTVQYLCGHSSPAVTARYARGRERAKIKALRRTHDAIPRMRAA